jgi:N-acyl-D-amino-acid deacylase
LKAKQNQHSINQNRSSQVFRWISFGLFLLCSGCSDQTAAYELVIRNGLVLDGNGSPAIAADVAISDGRFVQIGQIEVKGEEEIDASGLYVSPGWIDMMDQSGETLLKNGLAENKLLMGVTSAFGGEGGTPVPADQVQEYFKTLERQGISLNFGSYFNAFQAREEVVGSNDVKVAGQDIAAMQALMRRAMEAGAVGMSSSAFYAPASFMSTHELVELAKAIEPYGGIYAAHMRDESRKLLPAIEEMITVGQQAGVRVEIFHFKNASVAHWGENTVRAVRLIESAREQGVDIAANQYPYIAGGSGIDATVPTWVFADGPEQAYTRLRDPEVRAKLKREIADPNSDRMVANAGGWNNIVLLSAFNPDYERYQGMNFEDIGKALGQDPADAAWDILFAALPRRANALYFLMSELDVQFILQQPWVSIGSDAGTSLVLGQASESALPHPRTYGTFPRIIARYVRELGVLKLEEAIRKMTSYPASRMRMSERGVIREGNWADVVIFNYDTIQDNASWEQPLKTASGIEYVLVNGEIVVDRGKHNGKRPGQILYGSGYRHEGD